LVRFYSFSGKYVQRGTYCLGSTGVVSDLHVHERKLI